MVECMVYLELVFHDMDNMKPDFGLIDQLDKCRNKDKKGMMKIEIMMKGHLQVVMKLDTLYSKFVAHHNLADHYKKSQIFYPKLQRYTEIGNLQFDFYQIHQHFSHPLANMDTTDFFVLMLMADVMNHTDCVASLDDIQRMMKVVKASYTH